MARSQIDNLGMVLRSGRSDESTMRALENLYDDYETVALKIHSVVEAAVTREGFEEQAIFAQRNTKTLEPIVAKLAREKHGSR